ncbi:MAG: hypothetical protein A7315_08650 [Candidatus Altiarchaeales archaeon WOR_SM1_79]|nr:MAG: hypothetical protein A7315_08650 [Candidatus Altiarchaeales archaeon WOR_SM1_79]
MKRCDKNTERIVIALIALAVLSQCVSADTIGSKVNILCPPVTITNITVTDDIPETDGFQVDPVKPPCLDVIKCNATPSSKCCDSCGCFYLANGSFVGENGTHCPIGYGPGYQPVGFTACEYDPPYCTESPWNNGCDFDENGSWVGNNEGGYSYDINDGYTMGLKKVQVNVTITTSQIKWLCKNFQTGGSVSMTVDNYDSQKGTQKVYNFDDSPTCDPITGDPDATTANWTGYFYMHYWEKPGKYTVTVSVKSCCKASDKMSEIFDYMKKAGICIAPPGKNIKFGRILACGSNVSAVANGDYIQSNCGQCDLCSEPPTLRNIGNVMINLGVHATDMINNNGGGSRIPVSHAPGGLYGALGYQQGVLWINVDTGWNDLQDKKEIIALPPQIYCNHTEQQGCDANTPCANVTVYDNGLPPGPHAANNISLMIWPIPCVIPGEYSNSIFVSAIPKEDLCCQDHREPYIGSSECITPPQCYEEGRYVDLGMTRSEFRNICV